MIVRFIERAPPLHVQANRSKSEEAWPHQKRVPEYDIHRRCRYRHKLDMLFAAYLRASISIATFVYNTQPFMLVIMGAVFLSEHLTPLKAWPVSSCLQRNVHNRAGQTRYGVYR